MTRYNVPSSSRPGIEYEISLTDDGGLVCECQGYARKVAVSYVTGVRQGPHCLCRHAQHIAVTFGLAQRQPQLMWNNLANGDTFPITALPRSEEEHMLAYRYDGLLEPLEAAKDDIFPRHVAKPNRDRAGRVNDLLTTPPHNIVIVTTGTCPKHVTTQSKFRALVEETGATLKQGDVTAQTTVLAVGQNPNRKKLERAAQLLTPTVDFPGIVAILEGRRRQATDRHGHLLLKPNPPADLQAMATAFAEVVQPQDEKHQTSWLQDVETRHRLCQSLRDSANSVDRVIAELEAETPDPNAISLTIDTLNAISTAMRNMAARSAPCPAQQTRATG